MMIVKWVDATGSENYEEMQKIRKKNKYAKKLNIFS